MSKDLNALNEAAIAFDSAISDLAEEKTYAYALGFLLSQVCVTLEQELSVKDATRVLEVLARNATKKVTA